MNNYNLSSGALEASFIELFFVVVSIELQYVTRAYFQNSLKKKYAPPPANFLNRDRKCRNGLLAMIWWLVWKEGHESMHYAFAYISTNNDLDQWESEVSNV